MGAAVFEPSEHLAVTVELLIDQPAAMGQRGADCWQEIWPIIKPQIDDVMLRGCARGAAWPSISGSAPREPAAALPC